MNKKIIWIIVVLMSAAVVGVVWLEMDLIGNLMQENEEQFDNDVYSALNEVARGLEINERADELYSTLNGFATSYYQQDRGLQLTARQGFDLGLSLGASGSDNILGDLADKRKQLWDQMLTNSSMMMLYNQGNLDRPLEERIKPSALDQLIRKAFENRGIDPSENKYKYHYGVYKGDGELGTRSNRGFVIVDGHYVVEENRPRELGVDGDDKSLYSPDFKVNLFPKEEPSPGELRVIFPYRNNIIWSSLWQNFIGLLLFTGTILFCFFYTLNVVFRQKKLSEMKTDFINNMTHEFKTPIATISLAADSMTSPLISGDSSKVNRFANIIKQENRRMNGQVEKVLQMALLDKQDFNLKLTQVNLHEIIQYAVDNISLQVEKKDGVASTELHARQPEVQGDQTHISNVISNLLDNANKYTPDNPEITVSTRNVPGGVRVVVRDNGVGMTKEARKHIFDKFYRVHTGNLHDVKGFGLGLSYVKAMMSAHGGKIDVKSELGKGSSFILFFPFRAEN